jgi:hypothetical protein
MSDDTNTRPEFPEARAKKKSIIKTVWLMAAFGVVALGVSSWLVGSAIGYLDGRAGRAFEDSNAPWVLVGFALFAFIPTCWWSFKYWQSIDEMARRAHLDAFFWGGGMISWAIFLPFVLPMLVFPQFQLGMIEKLDGSSTHAFGLGAFAAIIITLLGYGVFWLFWWAKKR